MGEYKGKYVTKDCLLTPAINPGTVFCTVSLLCLFILILCFYFSGGELFSQYFFYDTRDTGMDFFHSIEYVRGEAPYELFNTLYPPLANLLFLVIFNLIPNWVTDKWPDDFGASVNMRATELDLRTEQVPLMVFLVFVIISCWIMCSLVVSVLKRMPYKCSNCIAVCMLMSPGMLIALERGNILLLVIPLTLLFVHFRNSENPVIRELALISLAVAAGMKLYPAFYGVLLLCEKKYAQAARAIIYGVLSVTLPMLVFKEGLSGIPMWLSVVFGFGSSNPTPWIGTGFSSILHRIALYVERYLHISIGTNWFSLAAMGISAILLMCTFSLKKDWQRVLAATMAIIMFQSQGEYIFGFLCIPMVLFFAQEQIFKKNNIPPFVLMTLLMVNLPLFYVRDQSYPNIAIKQLVSLLLVCWCIFNAVMILIYELKKGAKTDGNLEK